MFCNPCTVAFSPDGTYILISANEADVVTDTGTTLVDAGAMYMYTRDVDQWRLVRRLESADAKEAELWPCLVSALHAEVCVVYCAYVCTGAITRTLQVRMAIATLVNTWAVCTCCRLLITHDA